jgi:hypothetical protein
VAGLVRFRAMTERTLPNEEQLKAVIELGFDHLCAQRISAFLDPETILRGVDEVVKPARIAKLQARFIIPGRKRTLDALRASEITLGAWIPDDARAEIEAALGEPKPVPQDIIDDIVTSEKIRDDVRALLNDTISGFVSKAASVSDAATGGMLGKSPLGGFAAAGKNLLGGLGEGIQKQLQGRVRDFVDGSVAAVQQKIGDKLASEETAKAMGARAKLGFTRALTRTEADVAKLVEQGTPERFDGVAPSIVAHNAARPALREAVRAELAAVLAELEKQTIGEALRELGLYDLVKQTLTERGLVIAKGFVETPGFGAVWKTFA